MVRFLAWLDRVGPTGTIDEIAAAEKLRALRAETATRDGSELVDLSFDTISGAGPNGAIVHYRVSPETTRAIAPDTLYLVDSGAQYRDGTTDITRTVAIGTPSAEMRDRFTRVLKGHLAVAMARFPAGTSAPRSTRWRGSGCGRRASTSTTAPATASAPSSTCTRGRRASPSSARCRWKPA